MILRMIKEEWRMHSSLYSSGSFATFPFVVFVFSLSFSWMAIELSTLSFDSIGLIFQALGGFIGLAVGSIGFSSKDAMKNVLGPMNLLVYSSRTLPISEKKLVFDFIIKDILYYTGLFLIPIALGPLLIIGSTAVQSIFMMVIWFLVSLSISVTLARSSLKIPIGKILNYNRLNFLRPLPAKSILDVSRSSGGFIKIIFSLGILTGFYWFAVLYFPATKKLLTNPLLSFGVMLGVLNLSIYNWLNRFDSLESYIYLPVTRNTVLNAKKSAYLVLAIPSSLFIILISYSFYPFNLFLSALSAITTTVYTLLLASIITGIHPNKKLFSSKVFLKFLISIILVIVPLLIFSIIYSSNYLLHYLGICLFILIISLIIIEKEISQNLSNTTG